LSRPPDDLLESVLRATSPPPFLYFFDAVSPSAYPLIIARLLADEASLSLFFLSLPFPPYTPLGNGHPWAAFLKNLRGLFVSLRFLSTGPALPPKTHPQGAVRPSPCPPPHSFFPNIYYRHAHGFLFFFITTTPSPPFDSVTGGLDRTFFSCSFSH